MKNNVVLKLRLKDSFGKKHIIKIVKEFDDYIIQIYKHLPYGVGYYKNIQRSIGWFMGGDIYKVLRFSDLESALQTTCKILNFRYTDISW